MHMLKIGKISLLFLGIISSACAVAEQITLSVCDTNGMPTTHCTKNIPYALHIVMSDMQTSGDPIQAINFPRECDCFRVKLSVDMLSVDM